MRSIVTVVSIGIMLFLSGASFAETNAECSGRCATERTVRDEMCPPAAYEGDPLRAQCLQESTDAFDSCRSACPPPEPQTEMPPAEKAE